MLNGRTLDCLQRFVFEHEPITGRIVHLDTTWRAVLDRREYPAPVRRLLGELMAAGALLSSTIKFDGRLIIQARGHGPVHLLVVECTPEGAMRALAQWEGEIHDEGLRTLLGDAQLAITIEPGNGGDPYQGIVTITGNNVATMLEDYFARSEQLATRLWLAADDQQAAGMLVQRLPMGTETDTDAWDRAIMLGATITDNELLALSAQQIVRRLYHEEDIRLFSRVPMSFRCSCSRTRVESMLRMLGQDEIESVLTEQGGVHVACEFCGHRYDFDAVDAVALFRPHYAQEAPRERQ